MNYINDLENLGLSSEEATVYSFLLKEGGAFPSRIARQCNINRSTVYKILMRLDIKGLVSEVIKSKKQFYQPEPPRKLKTQANYQLKQAQEHILNVEKLIPRLENLALQAGNQPRVKHFTGKHGVLEVYRDHLNVKKPYQMVAWANPVRTREFVSDKFLKEYADRKYKLKIKTRGIVPESTIYEKYIPNIYRGITDPFQPMIKTVSNEQFPFLSEITMYSTNKISFINLEEANPNATIIEDKVMHEMLRFAFELSWQALE